MLRDACFEVAAGEIHALLGENGAGKTTLMNVLVGLVRPDAGRIEIGGAAVDAAHFGPAAALRAGVAMVHQHSALIPALTVAENLAYGDPRGGCWFRPERARRAGEALAGRFGFAVPMQARVEDLSVGERQRAEILRALGRGARVLVLDEPTASLTPGETLALFPALRRLRAEGCAVVFISHKLDEIVGLCDRVSVMRGGRVVETLEADRSDPRTLGRLLLGGRELPALVRPAPRATSPHPALVLRGLCAPGLREASRLRDVSLEVAPGEIVGIAGIDGNGQRELEEVLAGVRRPTAGRIEVMGREVAPHARALRVAGLAHLSGDRERSSLIPGLSLAENLVLKGTYDDARFFRRGRFDRRAARRFAAEAVRRFGIVPPDPDADVATLSGGNAQKLAAARELSDWPSVLLAVNPTRGLDVAATRFVHQQLLDLRARGGGVLLVGSDLDEVLALGDRILALVRGALVPVPPGADAAALGAILLGERAA